MKIGQFGVAPVLAILAALGGVPALAQTETQAETVVLADVVSNYADLALAGYEDAMRTAQDLQTAIEDLLGDPTEENLEAARTAWKVSRIPYLQTEVFRFGNPIVDDWEPRVNAWPVDEGLIDYVGPNYSPAIANNPFSTANIIASSEVIVDGETLSLSRITPETLTIIRAAKQGEANFAAGYHAIEFLLWGEDENAPVELVEGEDLLSGGTRPASDFSVANCTNSNCDRRSDYLFSAMNLLITDLEEMVENWQITGDARRAVTSDPQTGLIAMLTGMASLSRGELAGEHMMLGLLLNDAEKEQDDFSDYTYASHLFDARGVVNVYFGEYFAMDSSVAAGASLSDLLVELDPALDEEMRTNLGVTMARLRLMVNRARSVENYDQMIAANNPEGNDIIRAAVAGLLDQTKTIEKISLAFDVDELSILGSDSLDNPEAVLQ